MILISHRGNISGSIPERENEPDYIIEAINQGYDCEIDVWKTKDGWWLGHDEPKYCIEFSFLYAPGLWCHAKNFEALFAMQKQGIHCFMHDNDTATLTSSGYVWTHVDVSNHLKFLHKDLSIAVMPTLPLADLYGHCAGICADNISDYRLCPEK